MDKSSYLTEIANIIAGFKEIDVAYLFGSFLEKDEFNDIDLALGLSQNNLLTHIFFGLNV